MYAVIPGKMALTATPSAFARLRAARRALTSLGYRQQNDSIRHVRINIPRGLHYGGRHPHIAEREGINFRTSMRPYRDCLDEQSVRDVRRFRRRVAELPSRRSRDHQ